MFIIFVILVFLWIGLVTDSYNLLICRILNQKFSYHEICLVSVSVYMSRQEESNSYLQKLVANVTPVHA